MPTKLLRSFVAPAGNPAPPHSGGDRQTRSFAARFFKLERKGEKNRIEFTRTMLLEMVAEN